MTEHRNRRSGRRPWLLLLIGGGFLVLTAWSVYQAGRGASGVTDPDYYSHGLRYNETLLERKAAETLGWSIDMTLHGHHLQVSLKDRHMRPVTGAAASLTLFDTTRTRHQRLVMQEGPPGHYTVTIPEILHGELTAEAAFDRDGARLQKRALLTLR